MKEETKRIRCWNEGHKWKTIKEIDEGRKTIKKCLRCGLVHEANHHYLGKIDFLGLNSRIRLDRDKHELDLIQPSDKRFKKVYPKQARQLKEGGKGR